MEHAPRKAIVSPADEFNTNTRKQATTSVDLEYSCCYMYAAI